MSWPTAFMGSVGLVCATCVTLYLAEMINANYQMRKQRQVKNNNHTSG
jgi:hypothetical protein